MNSCDLSCGCWELKPESFARAASACNKWFLNVTFKLFMANMCKHIWFLLFCNISYVILSSSKLSLSFSQFVSLWCLFLHLLLFSFLCLRQNTDQQPLRGVHGSSQFTFLHQSPSQRKTASSQRPWRPTCYFQQRNSLHSWSRNLGNCCLLAGRQASLYSASFSIKLTSTCLGMTLPTVGWALLHQLTNNQSNPQTCPVAFGCMI